jgi:hypothetical protein
MRALILSGVLEDDGTLQLQIPFNAELPAQNVSQATGDDVVEVELLDDSGAVLSHAKVDAKALCPTPTGPGAPMLARRLVAGAVTMPDGTMGLRLRWRGGVIHEAHAPAGDPVVSLTWHPPADAVVSGRQLVTWDASHPADAPLHFLVFAQRPDGTHLGVASVQESQVDLDADLLPEDAVALIVIASDGFHQVSDQSANFTIAQRGR